MEREILILKREELNKEEYINICVWANPYISLGTEFIVWRSSKETPNNYYWGHYFNSLEEAENYFNKKIKDEE